MRTDHDEHVWKEIPENCSSADAIGRNKVKTSGLAAFLIFMVHGERMTG
jgi:hypothetical protein